MINLDNVKKIIRLIFFFFFLLLKCFLSYSNKRLNCEPRRTRGRYPAPPPKNNGGRNRIDVRGIFKNFARNGTNVIGPNFINANDNEMALAA